MFRDRLPDVRPDDEFTRLIVRPVLPNCKYSIVGSLDRRKIAGRSQNRMQAAAPLPDSVRSREVRSGQVDEVGIDEARQFCRSDENLATVDAGTDSDLFKQQGALIDIGRKRLDHRHG